MGKKKKKSLLFRYIEYLIVLSIVKCISIVSYKMASDIGCFLGRIGYLMDSRHRGIALKNLNNAFPDIDGGRINLIAKRAFENLGRSATETIYIASRKPQMLHKTFNEWITIEGRDNINTAAEKGKGIILLSAHFGNWELWGIVHAGNGYPLNAIARPLDNPWIERLLSSFRSVTGTRVIPKRGALKETLKSLKNREGVVILIDQNTALNEGVFVDFFGTPASTGRGPALIAMKSGSPVIPFFIIREGKYRHRIVYCHEIPVHKSNNIEEDVLINTENFTKVVELYIRKYPEQWFWMHQRWKTRPE